MRSSAKYIWWFVVLTFVVVFVFAETSGLTGRGALTRGTTVASVNGTDINYDTWLRAREQRIQQAQAQSPQPLTLDQEHRIEDATFDDLVNEILLRQEYERRGITVTDEQIRQAALEQPPQQFLANPEFQTEGQFDIDKYRRFLSSPLAKQSGVRFQLEQYYRGELPRQELFEQVASAVYVTDAQLWRIWQDSHDSARVSYVRFAPDEIPDSAVKVSEQEISAYFDAHKKDFEKRPGRAVVTVAVVPRTITAADSAKVRQHAEALRSEIESGKESFADAAKRESADTASAADGGFLGKVTKGQFVEQFDSAAFSLKPGVVSQPVLTPFGYHLIKVDEKKGDTISVRHILLRIQQSDSSASWSDSRADSLAKAASSDKPALFDSIAKSLGLQTYRAVATEGEPLTHEGRYVPSVSAWAFTARPGETSDLIDGQDAYYVARLDSLTAGGAATLKSEHDDIEQELRRQKKLDLLVPRAEKISAAVAKGETLEQAAKAAGLTVQQTPEFARTTSVPGLGQATQAVGAAFGLPKGAVSQPIKSDNGVFVIRVDDRVQADRAAWEKQKEDQRNRVLQGMRQQRVQQFLASLRESAEIEDHRKEIAQQNRQLAG
ncbi:MAG TPA: peptidylprolyl isomerase [Gemmatimonadaceae bacterium]|jgi:peptidyl-prolyl cis-trans isomerase D|nr:peptidylprolyl isomerase [Gemmatimonadaceae bacterium]